MAYTILSSQQHNKALHVLVFFSLVLLMQRVGATEFKVGGSKGWAVPSDSNALSYNQWAESNRFQIGDSLLFVYQPDKDSVLQVNKEDYTNCKTEAPIQVFKDGKTSIKFKQSGPHYFISGNKENCLKNQKMVVIVLADRSNQSSNSNQTSLASPPPSGSHDIIPSPAPIGMESPPPFGAIEIVPSPAPSGEESPSPPPSPNGASFMFVSFITSVGALVGSSITLVL